MSKRIAKISVLRKRDRTGSSVEDAVVVEEPLEIRVLYGPKNDRREYTLSITMRTPGDDEDLTRGFLFTEGLIKSGDDITGFDYTSVPGSSSVTAKLDPDVLFIPEDQQRHFYTTSSCGVCGKASIDMVRQVTAYRLIPDVPVLDESILITLARHMRSEQSVFQQTGGIHAAALFDASGELLQSREDVGRHNAVDKLIGWALTNHQVPLGSCIMVVSGRAGFELVQKASMAGIPIFAAVGAPSSLAVELARDSDMTLVGFLKESGYNIYAHPARIHLTDQ